MESETRARYQALLSSRLQALKDETNTNADSRNTVTLDQSSVGRLSRMDALQQQAMANATQARRNVEAHQICAAIQRLQDDEYGYCVDCGDEIPEVRLALALTATKCIACTGR